MATVLELIQKVRDEQLTLPQLESYRDDLLLLESRMHMEAAALEKEEALFMARKDTTESVAQRKVDWKGTDNGQALLKLKRELLAVKALTTSLKNRIYAHIGRI